LDVRLVWGAFGFAAAVTLVTALLFGLERIKASRRMVRTLALAQVALSAVLFMGAGLGLRTFEKLWTLDMGYDKEQVLQFSVDARLAGYTPDQGGGVSAVYREVLDRLRQLPQPDSVSASTVRPVDDSFYLIDRVDEVDGRRLAESGVKCCQPRLLPDGRDAVANGARLR